LRVSPGLCDSSSCVWPTASRCRRPALSLRSAKDAIPWQQPVKVRPADKRGPSSAQQREASKSEAAAAAAAEKRSTRLPSMCLCPQASMRTACGHKGVRSVPSVEQTGAAPRRFPRLEAAARVAITHHAPFWGGGGCFGCIVTLVFSDGSFPEPWRRTPPSLLA
jgi:hypothetical protein